ncbi:plasmid replication initiation protein [Alkalibacillus flavidus]|uniref:Plasmid replication initiation protein n=1 Tax=Alkalibacillus flavidus TaxID=546021 RepID=A0ABV2KY11_9BACI
MARKNDKQLLVFYEDSIKKSNEFSMAKLSSKLTLNQMQLLAYAIYSTQQNGKTEFIKADFEKKFNLGEYRREEAKQDSKKLFDLNFSLDDLETGEFDFLHVFQRINYKDGLFTFRWSEDIIPHILDLKDRYITNGFLTIANFKSGFSWILYDYLKGNYGYWRKVLSKESLMKLFCVEDKKTYQNNTGRFRQAVLDVAIDEINQFTELEVNYTVEREGRAIVAFKITWSTGETVKSATDKQVKELKTIVETIENDYLEFININNEADRQRAINILKENRDVLRIVQEPISITYKKADLLIRQANQNIKQLHYLANKPESPYYNWLEEE